MALRLAYTVTHHCYSSCSSASSSKHGSYVHRQYGWSAAAHEIRAPHHHYPAIQCAAITSPSSSSSSSRTARRQNIPGEFYVDHTCIDCDLCRWMAPDTFTRVDGQSAVYNQPATPNERVAALQALVSCPTASIRTEKPPADILQIHSTFPIPVDEETLPGVYHCGYHSQKSYSASSYFIKRPTGNILVDSPRYSERLAARLEELGGVDFIFLTHKDDVADHDRWQKRFQCPRILHEEEVTSGTAGVEIKLQGAGPWDLLGSDIDLLFTPGHTEACVCLYLKPLKALFTGDHLANSTGGSLHVDPNYNWYSMDIQKQSIKALIPLDFVWILPGHGRRAKFNNVVKKNMAIDDLLARM